MININSKQCRYGIQDFMCVVNSFKLPAFLVSREIYSIYLGPDILMTYNNLNNLNNYNPPCLQGLA